MIHIGNLIKTEFYRQGRSVSWLAEQLHCDRTNVYDIFQRESIDTTLLRKISILLQHDFFKDYSKEIHL